MVGMVNNPSSTIVELARIKLQAVLAAIFVSWTPKPVESSVRKVRIHVPQRVKVVHHHHHHIKHKHHYANSFGYHYPLPKFHPSPHKRIRWRPPRKVYGLRNYAGKFKGWTPSKIRLTVRDHAWAGSAHKHRRPADDYQEDDPVHDEEYYEGEHENHDGYPSEEEYSHVEEPRPKRLPKPRGPPRKPPPSRRQPSHDVDYPPRRPSYDDYERSSNRRRPETSTSDYASLDDWQNEQSQYSSLHDSYGEPIDHAEPNYKAIDYTPPIYKDSRPSFKKPLDFKEGTYTYIHHYEPSSPSYSYPSFPAPQGPFPTFTSKGSKGLKIRGRFLGTADIVDGSYAAPSYYADHSEKPDYVESFQHSYLFSQKKRPGSRSDYVKDGEHDIGLDDLSDGVLLKGA